MKRCKFNPQIQVAPFQAPASSCLWEFPGAKIENYYSWLFQASENLKQGWNIKTIWSHYRDDEHGFPLKTLTFGRISRKKAEINIQFLSQIPFVRIPKKTTQKFAQILSGFASPVKAIQVTAVIIMLSNRWFPAKQETSILDTQLAYGALIRIHGAYSTASEQAVVFFAPKGALSLQGDRFLQVWADELTSFPPRSSMI